METDISKTTVTILLILTILASILGTWVTIESLSAPSSVQVVPGHQQTSGKISLNLVKPVNQEDDASGKISLKIAGGD